MEGILLGSALLCMGAWYLGMAFLVCTAFSTFFFFPPPPGEFKLQLIAVLPEGGHVDALSFR